MCEELDFVEQFYCGEWQELRSDAVSGLGIAPIPYTAIRKWLVENEIPDGQKRFCHAVIRAIDRNYCVYRDEEQEAQSKKQAKLAKMQRGGVNGQQIHNDKDQHN